MSIASSPGASPSPSPPAPEVLLDDDGDWGDEADEEMESAFACVTEMTMSEETNPRRALELESRRLFRHDLEGCTCVPHQDDIEHCSAVFYFDTSRMSQHEMLYAGATVELALDCSEGVYRTDDAPLPKFTISEAGGAQLALTHACRTWFKTHWRSKHPATAEAPASSASSAAAAAPSFLKRLFSATPAPRADDSNNFLANLCQFVLERLATITNFCPLCGRQHAHQPLKLVPCQSKVCTYQCIELGVGCDPEFELRTNPSGVDYLITATYAAAASGRRQDVLVPFPEQFVTLQRKGDDAVAAAAAVSSDASPAAVSNDASPAPTFVNGVPAGPKSASPLDHLLHVPLEASGNATAARDYDIIVAILDTMPSVNVLLDRLLEGDKPRDRFASFKETAPVTLRALLTECHPQAYYLLCWILSTNRSYLREVPLEMLRKSVAPLVVPDCVRQAFQFASMPPEKEHAFAQKLAAPGTRRELVFHGASSECFHSVVRNSLVVMSNTRLMTAGAAYGVGVYFGKNFETSQGYSQRGVARAWPGAASASACHYSMLICELAINDKCKDHGFCYVHTDEDAIAPRYLLRF